MCRPHRRGPVPGCEPGWPLGGPRSPIPCAPLTSGEVLSPPDGRFPPSGTVAEPGRIPAGAASTVRPASRCLPRRRLGLPHPYGWARPGWCSPGSAFPGWVPPGSVLLAVGSPAPRLYGQCGKHRPPVAADHDRHHRRPVMSNLWCSPPCRLWVCRPSGRRRAAFPPPWRRASCWSAAFRLPRDDPWPGPRSSGRDLLTAPNRWISPGAANYRVFGGPWPASVPAVGTALRPPVGRGVVRERSRSMTRRAIGSRAPPRMLGGVPLPWAPTVPVLLHSPGRPAPVHPSGWRPGQMVLRTHRRAGNDPHGGHCSHRLRPGTGCRTGDRLRNVGGRPAPGRGVGYPPVRAVDLLVDTSAPSPAAPKSGRRSGHPGLPRPHRLRLDRPGRRSQAAGCRSDRGADPDGQGGRAHRPSRFRPDAASGQRQHDQCGVARRLVHRPGRRATLRWAARHRAGAVVARTVRNRPRSIDRPGLRPGHPGPGGPIPAWPRRSSIPRPSERREPTS